MFFFTAYDCSEEPYQVEKFVLKFGNADCKQWVNYLLVAAKFKQAFNDAKEFNRAAKADEELVYAPVIQENDDEEPKKEKAEEKTETKEEKTEDK